MATAPPHRSRPTPSHNVHTRRISNSHTLHVSAAQTASQQQQRRRLHQRILDFLLGRPQLVTAGGSARLNTQQRRPVTAGGKRIVKGEISIGEPYNFVHVNKVGIDSRTGAFTGIPSEWQSAINTQQTAVGGATSPTTSSPPRATADNFI